MEHAYAQKRAGFLLLSLFPHFNETVIWKGWGLRHILGTSHTSKGNDSGVTQALGFQQSFVLKIWISYLKMLCRQNRLLFRYFSLTSWKYINNLVFVSFGPVCNVLYVPQFIYRLLNSSFISVFFFFLQFRAWHHEWCTNTRRSSKCEFSAQIALRSDASELIRSTPDTRKVHRTPSVNIGVGFKCHQRIRSLKCALSLKS